MNDPTSAQPTCLIRAFRRSAGIAYTSALVVLFMSSIELFAGTTDGLLEVLLLGGLAAFAVAAACADARGRFKDVHMRMSTFVGEVERRRDEGSAWETVHGFELHVGDVCENYLGSSLLRKRPLYLSLSLAVTH